MIKFKRVRVLVGSVLIVALSIFAVYCRVLVVNGSSMYPTYGDGEKLVAVLVHSPEDIPPNYPACWIVTSEGRNMIKRLIGYPGQTVELVEGDTYVDGELIMNCSTELPRRDNLTFELGEGEYLFLGDNRLDSLDARYWNPYALTIDNIKGVVIGGGLF